MPDGKIWTPGPQRQGQPARGESVHLSWCGESNFLCLCRLSIAAVRDGLVIVKFAFSSRISLKILRHQEGATTH